MTVSFRTFEAAIQHVQVTKIEGMYFELIMEPAATFNGHSDYPKQAGMGALLDALYAQGFQPYDVQFLNDCVIHHFRRVFVPDSTEAADGIRGTGPPPLA
jgi:hypothetical protein